MAPPDSHKTDRGSDDDKRQKSDRRAERVDRRKGTDTETRKLFKDYGFEDERQGDRRSGRDRRDRD